MARQGGAAERSRTHYVRARLVPDFSVAAAGNPTIAEELRKGKQLGDKTYKVYLDGYNQMDLITGKGPSARHSIFYFNRRHAERGAVGRFQVSLHRSAGWLVGRHGQG